MIEIFYALSLEMTQGKTDADVSHVEYDTDVLIFHYGSGGVNVH